MYVQELPWQVNYNESEVPLYTLPDVLTAVDGSKITTAAQWEANRGALVQVFRDVMYGRRPPMADKVEYTLLSEKKDALDGTAVMRQVELKFTMNNGKSHKAVMLLFIPADAKGPVPVYCGLTFIGNHVVCDDPDILITGTAGAEFRSFDYTRGAQSRRFDLKTFMKRSIALAVCSYHDFFPDDYRGWKKSIWSLFVPEEEMEPRIKNASAIGAWAWGLSRMLDYLETVPEIDADKAAVFGHSRLGKTSLWAAVDLIHSVGNMERCGKLFGRLDSCSDSCLQIAVEIGLFCRRRHYPGKILLCHCMRTAYEISEIVGKIVVVSRDNGLVCDRSVCVIRHFGQSVMTHSVHTDILSEGIGKNNVALGFAHLVLSEIEPRMTKDFLGERQIQSHKEYRPINGVESKNILTDDMHVGGPIFFEMIALLIKALIGIVAKRRDIVCKSIQPYVNNVLIIKIYRDTPLKRRS